MKQVLTAILFAFSTCFLLPITEAKADDAAHTEKDWERGFEFRIGAAPQITLPSVGICNRFHTEDYRLRSTPECDYGLNTTEVGYQTFFEIGYRWPGVGIYWTHGINRSYVVNLTLEDPKLEKIIKRTSGLYYHTTLQVRGLIDVYENLELVIGGGIGLWKTIAPVAKIEDTFDIHKRPERETPGILLPISLVAGLQWHFTENMALSFEVTYSGAISIFSGGIVQVIQPAILWSYTL